MMPKQVATGRYVVDTRSQAGFLAKMVPVYRVCMHVAVTGLTYTTGSMSG